MGENLGVLIFVSNLQNSCQAPFCIELFSLGFSDCATPRFFRPKGDKGSPKGTHLLHKSHPHLHPSSVSLNCLQLASSNMFSISFQDFDNKMPTVNYAIEKNAMEIKRYWCSNKAGLQQFSRFMI